MTNKTMSAAKALGAIMTAGGAAVMIGTAMSSGKSTKKQIRKTADKAVKTINSIIDSVQSMM